MSTTRGQRIGIWVIVIFMILGTIGSFLMIALANKNAANDTARIQALETQYQKDTDAYKEKLQALFTERFGDAQAYLDRVAAFEAASVTELQHENISVGTGSEVKEGESFKAFYIGWNPQGEIFDSSFENGAVKSGPFDTSVGVIDGWKQGVVGMHEGGVRLLTIPSSLAYGESGSGEKIPANTPLKFIIFVVPSDTQVPEQPEMPDELYQNLLRQYGQGV